MLHYNGHGASTAFGKVNWAEKRSNARRPTNEAATIVVNGNHEIDCVLVNLSETGACLRVQSFVGIPEIFHLKMMGEPSLRECHFRWALDGCVGVKFL